VSVRDGDADQSLPAAPWLGASAVSFNGLEDAEALLPRGPRHIGPDALAAEAADTMERFRISQLLVVASDGELLGAVTTHDLMRAKVI
jgi:CBS domain-containing protein